MSIGCGKTEIVQEFANAGFDTMDEAFMDMPSYCCMHPQSVVMETNWICGWFQRILKEASQGGENKVLVVDRSPLSAVFYTRNKQGRLLAPLIAAQILELRDAGIDVYTVHVKCETDILWQRIQRRLSVEPERALYKEDSIEWLHEVQTFYNNFEGWDFTVDNSVDDRRAVRNVMRNIVDSVSTKSPKMSDARKIFFDANPTCKRIALDGPSLKEEECA